MPKLFKEKKSSGAVFRQRQAEKEKAGKRICEALKEYLTSHKRRKQDTAASEPVSNVASESVQINIDESSTSSLKQPITVQEVVNVDDANTGQIPEQQDDEQPSTSSYSVYLKKTIDPEGSNDEEEEREELQQEEQSTSLAILDLSDPANWPAVLTTSLRDALVRKGPAKQKTNFIFPKDAANRCFTKANYK
ncbi:Hypothetical predicted protein [Pelobates cultripes]|uniref:Uncharacterized protein n=1 Tax=Pelobates cultripes TaxID=61616 RepID=A0AAD1WAE8_PELCU|nr:Hypothetical predicted protein [Pelobates cultripes]